MGARRSWGGRVAGVPLVVLVAMSMLSARWGAAQDGMAVADPYAPQALAKGKVNLVGSTTMGELGGIWADGFRHVHPDVTFAFKLAGSEDVPATLAAAAAMAESTVFGMMSRPLTPEELDTASKQHNVHLHPVAVAYDVIVVVVHPDNPVPSLTLQQLQSLWARGEARATWGAVGMAAPWNDREVARVGRDSHSGTRHYFLDRIGLPLDQEGAVTTAESGAKVVERVSAAVNTVGYASLMSVVGKRVRVVPISAAPGVPAALPTAASLGNGAYPLVRPLQLVAVTRTERLEDPLAAEFVRYVLSRSGQDDVRKDGFLPLTRPQLLTQLDRLGWNNEK